MKKIYGALAVVVLSFILLTAGARTVEAATNCTATLTEANTDLTLTIPVLYFDNPYWTLISVSLKYHPSTDSHIWFYVLNTGQPTDCANPPTMYLNSSNAYIMHIPILLFQNISYKADLEYVPYNDGLVWFKVISAVQN